MRRVVSFLLPLLFLVFQVALLAETSCVGSPAATSATKPNVVACPLGVSSTRIRVVDTPNGVDLLFVTSAPGAVDELRTRVTNQIARHGPERREGLGHNGRHGTAHGHGLRLWAMPQTNANVVNETSGVRLVLVPVNPSERDGLRDAVIRRVAHLEAQGCPE